jgi:hypothetical protein
MLWTVAEDASFSQTPFAFFLMDEIYVKRIEISRGMI